MKNYMVTKNTILGNIETRCNPLCDNDLETIAHKAVIVYSDITFIEKKDFASAIAKIETARKSEKFYSCYDYSKQTLEEEVERRLDISENRFDDMLTEFEEGLISFTPFPLTIYDRENHLILLGHATDEIIRAYDIVEIRV